MFERAFVRDVLDFIGAKLQKTKQRVAFGGSPVADDPFSGSPQMVDGLRQLDFDALNILGEVDKSIEPVQTARLLVLQNLFDAGLDFAFALALDKDAQLAMVQGQPLCIYNFKAMRFKQPAHRAEGPIGDVLVVNGIERALVENIDEVMRLDHKDASGRQRGVQALEEVLEFRNVRERIRGGDG